MQLIRKIKSWYNENRVFAILDPKDNSVTLSSRLFKLIQTDADKDKQPSVFVFSIIDNKEQDTFKRYAFTVSPDLEQETQLCSIQYNAKHRCVGFESLLPSVPRILFDFRLPNQKVRLKVERRTTTNGIIYYEFMNPNK